ncbi:MAG: histidine phosphatase family protein, partial [Propionicimonas sp.]|nr:histidine phosphatase family protein [Propionicimonas sp.]
NVGLVLDTAVPGADLDEAGRAQAEALVERLAAFPVEAIFTSDLVRTQQTARPVAEHRGLELQVLPGLREISAGDEEMRAYAPGETSQYLATMVAWGSGHPEARVPGGEDLQEVLDRFDDAIATVAASGHEVVMVVSHGAALRVWSYARVAGFPQAIGAAHLDNTGVIVADGSPEDGWTLAHLEGVRSHDAESANA